MYNLQDDFKDIHKNKMAFLLGTGVSLNSIDTELLKPYITLGINESVFKLPDPDYFFSCDGGIFYHGLLDVISKKTKIVLSNELDFTEETCKEELDNHNISNYCIVKRKFDTPEPESSTMRKTDDKLVFGMGSPHPAAHLLYIMGCSPIVLLGCECRFTGNTYAFWMVPEYKNIITDYYKDEQGNPKHPAVFPQHLAGYLTQHRQYWDNMKRFCPDAPFINSCNGVQETIKKMTLSEVLYNYGDRTK